MHDLDPLPPPNRWSAWLPRVLVESALIVFSVLLALAVDEWRDERAAAARSHEAITAIIAELGANKAAAERASEFHAKVHARLQAMAAEKHTPTITELEGGVLQSAALVQTAWVTARDTGAVASLPLEVLLKLSHVYERQAYYMELSTQLGNDVYVDIRRRGFDIVFRESLPGFGALTREFSSREAGLIRNYDEMLTTLAALPH